MDQPDQTDSSSPSWGYPSPDRPAGGYAGTGPAANAPVPMPYGPVPMTYAPVPAGPHAYPQGPSYPDHPQGTTVLVLGILALSLFVTGPFAWYIGSKAKKEIAAGGQHYANERDIHIGRLLGMIATLVWGGGIVLYIVFIVIFIGIFASVLGSFPR